MDVHALIWNFAEDRLPSAGTMVYFAPCDDRRMLNGRFANGGFNDLASGDFYAPRSVDRWRVEPRRATHVLHRRRPSDRP
jgi:hypothetical protein